MPPTQIVLYRESDGVVPLLDWLDGLPPQARAKCRVRIERLAQLGYELRRPEADTLRDGIHELRASLGGLHYRILYFFHGRSAAVLSHGIVKEQAVPEREIDLARWRKRMYERDPRLHSTDEA